MTQTTPDDAIDAVSPSFNPLMVQELIEMPTAAQAWFRVNAVKVAHHIMQTITHPTVPVSQKIAFMQACAKNGNLMPERIDSASGMASARPMVNIVFGGNPERSISIKPCDLLETGDE